MRSSISTHCCPRETRSGARSTYCCATTKPDDLYEFEDRTFEGFARPPGNLVDRTVRDTLIRRGTTEDFVLVEEWVAEAPD